MSVDWQTASERLNRFRTLDADLQHDLAQLAMEQSRDDKLASKLEEGRIYGLRQEYYHMKLRKELARTLRVHSFLEDHG